MKATIESLAKFPERGRPVRRLAGLRSLVIVRRRGRHGHIAIYSLADAVVNVIHVFGTAQDWERKLEP